VGEFLENTNSKEFEEGGKFHVEDVSKNMVMDRWFSKGHILVSTFFKYRESLPKFNLGNMFRDTNTSCYMSFQNGIVHITGKEIKLLDFDVCGNKYRMSNQLVQRLNIGKGFNGKIKVDAKSTNPLISNSSNETENLFKSITSIPKNKKEHKGFKVGIDKPILGKEFEYNESGYKSLMSSMGYLLHKKNTTETKLMLYQDRYITTGKRMGGNGKSLIWRALEMCTPLVEIQCDDIVNDSSERFHLSDVTLGTRVIVYDEVPPLGQKFHLQKIYGKISSSVQVDVKGKSSFKLKDDDCPKLCGTTNYIVFDKDSRSDMRRLHITELSNIGSFHPDEINRSWGSSKHLLGQMNPKEDPKTKWSQNDWNDFYNFMFRCVQLYLREGLIEEDNQVWKSNVYLEKYYNEFGETEIDWCSNYLTVSRLERGHHILDNRPFSFELYDELKTEIPNTILTETTMKQMLFSFGKELGYTYNPTMEKNGDTPNLRKLQKTYKDKDGKSHGQKHTIHITHKDD
jgi:hypothetical protein